MDKQTIIEEFKDLLNDGSYVVYSKNGYDAIRIRFNECIISVFTKGDEIYIQCKNDELCVSRMIAKDLATSNFLLYVVKETYLAIFQYAIEKPKKCREEEFDIW